MKENLQYGCTVLPETKEELENVQEEQEKKSWGRGR